MAFSILLSGCAVAPPVKLVDFTFPNETLAVVQSRAVAACLSQGMRVDQSSELMVGCSMQLQRGKAYAAMLLMPDTTIPYLHIQYAIFAKDGMTHASAHEWLEGQNNAGKISHTELNDDQHVEEIKLTLSTMGGKP